MAELEDRVKTLEDKISKLSSNLYFGKSYSGVGSTNSDLLLKTRAGVKILCGRKFIDLIKDGKIAVDDVEFIFEADEVGDDDGIYVIGEGDDVLVILKVGDLTITLLGEIGTTYVSFMGEQETTGEMKYTALTNIGFIYSTLADAQADTALLNGIIYVEATQTLYTVVNGVLTEYTFEFPNPFTEQFVIVKTSDEEGALVILGEGIENSLMFDSLTIYVEDGKSYIESEGDIKIYRNGNLKLTITGTQAIFTTDVVSSTFMSEDATSTYGFRLYMLNGESTLEVDNLIVRNGIDVASTLHYFPLWWHYSCNRITAVSFFDASSNYLEEDSDEEEYDGENYTSLGLLLTLNYITTFVVGDYGYIYILLDGESETTDDSEDSEEEDSNKVWTLIPFTVINVSDSSVYVLILSDNMDSDILGMDYEDLCDDLIGMPIFKVVDSTLEKTPLLRIGENIDFIESTSLEEASSTNSSDDSMDAIVARVGNLIELEKYRHITDSSSSDEEELIEGNGIYAKILVANEALYDSAYELAEDDNSSRFASTEWVSNKTLGFGIITDEISEIVADKSADTLIIKAGNNINIDYNSETKTITIGTVSIIAGDNVTVDYDEETNTYTISASGSNTTIEAGSNVTVDYDEETNTYTISATVSSDGSVDLSSIEDAIAALEERVETLENREYYVVTLVLTNLYSNTGTVYIIIGGNSASFTLEAENGYSLPSSITVTSAGSTLTDYTYSSTTGNVVINNITNNTIVTALGVADSTYEYTIKFNLSNVTSSIDDGYTVESGDSVSFTLTVDASYVLETISITMGGSALTLGTDYTYTESIDSSTTLSVMNITISNITGNIVVTATAYITTSFSINCELREDNLLESGDTLYIYPFVYTDAAHSSIIIIKTDELSEDSDNVVTFSNNLNILEANAEGNVANTYYGFGIYISTPLSGINYYPYNSQASYSYVTLEGTIGSKLNGSVSSYGSNYWICLSLSTAINLTDLSLSFVLSKE